MKIYKQMKARVKVNVIEEKKPLFGAAKKQYVTRQLSVEELAKVPPGAKEQQGYVIQELSVSKLALLSL